MNTLKQKTFTQTEANNALAYVQKITEDIIRKWEVVLSLSDDQRKVQLESLEQECDSSMLPHTKSLMNDIKYHTQELSKVGCHIRDFKKGVVLFPTSVHGKSGYFVWEYGESKVERMYERLERRTTVSA